jgi:pyroglutamyl-peptidase
MKNLLYLTVFCLTPVFAKPIVLISYYDAFGRGSVNNSGVVATELARRFNTPESPIEIKLCPLQTVFDKAYAQTEICLKGLGSTPSLVLGLGETGCDMKVETMMRNRDRTFGPDNEGNQRVNTPVIPDGPQVVALKYPLPQMYCALSKEERKDFIISNFAGTFVCNNTAYQVAHYYPELTFGFIHVPTYNCRNFKKKTDQGVASLEKMILKAVQIELGSPAGVGPLPLSKGEIQGLKNRFEKTDRCLYEFYKDAKDADDLRRKDKI